MKDCDSRSLIGGEGLPSRDHTCQGEERSEEAASWFHLIEARGKGSIIQSMSYNISECVHGLHWIHVCIHRFAEGKACTP
jgi:hypothetical protein